MVDVGMGEYSPIPTDIAMSQLSTIPVFHCRHCGAPVYVTYLNTLVPDPYGKLLNQIMRGLERVALCPSCQRKRDYLAQNGRLEEFYENEKPELITNRRRFDETANG
jgi:hypothetical protein